MNYHYSTKVPTSDTDAVGDLLRVAANPEIISFAGGLPAPELFPVEKIQAAANQVFQEKGMTALQYGSSKGIPELRKIVVERLKQDGITVDEEQIMISTGSQQVLDLTSKMFINEGDTVIVEQPTYLCALDVFKSYEANLVSVEMDENGMKLDMLEEALKANPNTKMIYTIPNFQNPTGRTLSLERRKKLAQLAVDYDVLVLEDNPYGAVRFEGTPLPAIRSFDETGHVIYTSTFSKILAPGLRLGWVVAPLELINKFTIMKQSVDLHSDNLAQYIVAAFFENNDIDQHISKITALYKERKDLMMAAIKKYFPETVTYSQPEGGMFIWIEVPGITDTQELFDRCIQNNVAFVPGEPFYCDEIVPGTFRLNYSNMPAEQIDIGMKRLAEAIDEVLAQSTIGYT
ncbi:PLP-dependent aminotransferase family protein [Candidatus Enterococcus ferrettii]|uniref:2-aminoadipate transaminase n=1 Tax=Candidatus Enterococcus ferrettii TaxID=2815324 RepID=A0ABV0EUR4_9ENTE|nr:PLP-dependent aminotransferase family protein [Enterococcus sp. 665A]MBO1339419.1 PLP-dependent aminotransferase family protein [Enterococcus sp. 665A]